MKRIFWPTILHVSIYYVIYGLWSHFLTASIIWPQMNQRMTIRKSEKKTISQLLHNFKFRNKSFLLFYSTQRSLKRSTQPPPLFLNGSLFFQEKMCHDMFIVSGYDRRCNSIHIRLPTKGKNIWIFAPK